MENGEGQSRKTENGNDEKSLTGLSGWEGCLQYSFSIIASSDRETTHNRDCWHSRNLFSIRTTSSQTELTKGGDAHSQQTTTSFTSLGFRSHLHLHFILQKRLWACSVKTYKQVLTFEKLSFPDLSPCKKCEWHKHGKVVKILWCIIIGVW